MRIHWQSVVSRFVPVACFLSLSFALFALLALLMSATASAITADPAARAAEAENPSSAIVRKLDGTEVTLAAPLSLQGDLEASCGWRFLALDVTRIREVRRLEDGRYVLAGDEGELTVQPGWSAVSGKGEWGYERIPLAEAESIVFEGGSPGAPPQAAFYWTVTDECGQETRLACPENVEWTTTTCLPAAAPAQYGRFRLKVYPAHIVTATREADAGGMYLRLADGTELDGVTFDGDVLLTGQTQFGHLAVPLAQVQALAPDPVPPVADALQRMWEVIDISGERASIRPDDSGDTLHGSYGLFRLTFDLAKLQSLRREPAGSESFTLLDANGSAWPNLTLDPDQELAAGRPPLEISLAISDLLGIRALDPPPPEPAVEPAWLVTDTLGGALPAATWLAYKDGVWAESGAVAISNSSLASMHAVSVTQRGLTLTMPPPLGVIEVVSGTLSGEIAPGQSFTIAVSSVAAVQRRVAAPLEPAAPIGVIRLREGLELPVTSMYNSLLGHFGFGVQGDLVEYYWGNGKVLEEWGFRVTDGTIELSCTVSGVCPRGRLMWAEGEEEFAADDRASWRLDGLGLSAPWGEIEEYAPAELPPLEDFAPSVAITVTGRQDESVAFLGRDVRFMQTRRLSPGWCCAGPSIFDYPAMNVVETGGMTRTVEVNALAALEFDAEYGYQGIGLPENLSARLISRQGGALDVQLDPAEPPGHHAFYWVRSREGLIVDVGGGMQIIIPFRKAKRIELGWLE